MYPEHLKLVRQRLGLSVEAFARAVQVSSGRTVRKWEAGDRDIPGPLKTLLELVEAVPEARAWLSLRQENPHARQ